MKNQWIEKLELKLKDVDIFKNPRARKRMWEKKVKPYVLEDGDILEFGVADGGSIGWFPKHLPGFNVYGFDSFLGLPDDWNLGNTILKRGHFSTNGIAPKIENVEFIVGKFEDTFQEWFSNYKGFASIIHIDCDLYSSTKLVLQYIKPHLKVGTFILFDELTHMKSHPQYIHNRQHEYKAFKEFLIDNPTIDFDVVGRTNICQVAIKITKI